MEAWIRVWAEMQRHCIHRGVLQTIRQGRTTMKKLHLDVNALRVETFATQPDQRATGTVNAYQFLTNDSCGDDTTWAETNYCSNNCSRNTCVSCTNEN
jgi:hypothetical protein